MTMGFAQRIRTNIKGKVKYERVIVNLLISRTIIADLNIGTFLLMAVIITVIFNSVFLLLFRKTEAFGYLAGLVKRKLGRG